MPLLLPHYLRRKRFKQEETLSRSDYNDLLVHSKKLYSFEPKEGINGTLWHRVVQEKCLNFSKKMKLVASQKHSWNFSITALKNIAVLDLSIDMSIQKVNLAFLKSMINLEILRLHIENNSSLVHVLSLLCYSVPKLQNLEIEIGLSSPLKSVEVHFFEKCLHYFKHLNTFALKFKKATIDKYSESANVLLNVIAKSILEMSKLKNFELDLLPFDYDEKTFSLFLQNLFQLKSLCNLCLKNLDTEIHPNSLARVNLMKIPIENSEATLSSLSIHRVPFFVSEKLQFFDSLASMKSLRSLNLGVRAVQSRNNQFDLLGESLSSLKQLERLNLSLDDFAISGDLESLGRNLGKLFFLNSLKVDIVNIDFINFDDIIKFCKGIADLYNLTEFAFTYGHLHPQSSLSLKPVIRHFSGMQRLSSFKLAEWSISDRKGDDIAAFLESPSPLSDKDELKLEIRPFDLNTYRLIHKASTMTSSYNFKKLLILAEGCLDLENHDLVVLLKSFSEIAPEVRELNLDLAQCTGLKADSFSDLMTAINGFNLRSLVLNLDKTNLSDDCMLFFAEMLFFQKKLEKLDVGLGAFGGSTAVGMVYFYQNVSKHLNLRELKICHTNYNFSKVLWKMIFEELSRMHFLRALALEYFGCGFMTDYALEKLSLALSEIKHLQFFRLLPGSNSSFSDFGLSCLLRPILEMKELSEIRIDFKNMPLKLSNEMKLHFVDVVAKMPTIKTNQVTFQE